MFSMRIVTADHYMSEPSPGLDMIYSEFRSAKIYKLPVITLYGPTPSGQKTCMHIHGVFPYLYIPYDGSQPLTQHLQQFAISLDRAINIASNNASSSRQHVYKVSVVSGIPFYGYHACEQPFLKIYLYSPLMVKKAADLLLAGAVMNRVFQPHEAHIPYILQMFIDYNLFGMNFINAGAVMFRHPLPVGQSTPSTTTAAGHTNQYWNAANISRDNLLDEELKRKSCCELEVDIVAADIKNRLQIDDQLGSNPGLNALWEDERQRRHICRLVDNLQPPSSPDRSWSRTDCELTMLDKLRSIVHSQQQYITVMATDSNNLSADHQLTELSDSMMQRSVSLDAHELIDKTLEPVVNEESVKQTTSCSQQSIHHSQLLSCSTDKSLVDMLASLAGDSSQHVVETLQDTDSILSQVLPQSAEISQQIETESLEMSQRVWYNDQQEQEQEQTVSQADNEDVRVLLEGMDHSWDSSHWISLHHNKDMDANSLSSDDIDDRLLQLDGPTDTKRLTRKRPRTVSELTADVTCNSDSDCSVITERLKSLERDRTVTTRRRRLGMTSRAVTQTDRAIRQTELGAVKQMNVIESKSGLKTVTDVVNDAVSHKSLRSSKRLSESFSKLVEGLSSTTSVSSGSSGNAIGHSVRSAGGQRSRCKQQQTDNSSDLKPCFVVLHRLPAVTGHSVKYSKQMGDVQMINTLDQCMGTRVVNSVTDVTKQNSLKRQIISSHSEVTRCCESTDASCSHKMATLSTDASGSQQVATLSGEDYQQHQASLPCKDWKNKLTRRKIVKECSLVIDQLKHITPSQSLEGDTVLSNSNAQHWSVGCQDTQQMDVDVQQTDIEDDLISVGHSFKEFTEDSGAPAGANEANVPEDKVPPAAVSNVDCTGDIVAASSAKKSTCLRVDVNSLDIVDDWCTDSLYNMALYSSPEGSDINLSPPQPHSPTDNTPQPHSATDNTPQPHSASALCLHHSPTQPSVNTFQHTTNRFISTSQHLYSVETVSLLVSNAAASQSDRLSDIADQRSDIADRPVDIADQRSDIADQRSDIADRPVDIADQRSDIADQRSDIADRPVDIADQRSDIADRPVDIADQRSDIADQRSDIADQRSDIADRPVDIADQRSDIADRPVDIADQRSDIADRPVDIADQRSDIADRPVDITDQRSDIADRPVDIADHRSDIADRPVDITPTHVSVTQGSPVEISSESQSVSCHVLSRLRRRLKVDKLSGNIVDIVQQQKCETTRDISLLCDAGDVSTSMSTSLSTGLSTSLSTGLSTGVFSNTGLTSDRNVTVIQAAVVDDSTVEQTRDVTAAAVDNGDCMILQPANSPPSHHTVLLDLAASQTLVQSTLDAFYGDPKDLTAQTRDCEAKIQVRSPMLSDLPDCNSTCYDVSGLRHLQSVILTRELLVASSQTQLDTCKLVSCPSILAAALVTDPVITMVPSRQPPPSHSISKWLHEKFLSKTIKTSVTMNSEMCKNQPNTDGAENQPNTDAAENQPNTDAAENQPNTDTSKAENQPITDGAENQPNTDGAENQPNTDTSKAENQSTCKSTASECVKVSVSCCCVQRCSTSNDLQLVSDVEPVSVRCSTSNDLQLVSDVEPVSVRCSTSNDLQLVSDVEPVSVRCSTSNDLQLVSDVEPVSVESNMQRSGSSSELENAQRSRERELTCSDSVATSYSGSVAGRSGSVASGRSSVDVATLVRADTVELDNSKTISPPDCNNMSNATLVALDTKSSSLCPRNTTGNTGNTVGTVLLSVARSSSSGSVLQCSQRSQLKLVKASSVELEIPGRNSQTWQYLLCCHTNSSSVTTSATYQPAQLQNIEVQSPIDQPQLQDVEVECPTDQPQLHGMEVENSTDLLQLANCSDIVAVENTRDMTAVTPGTPGIPGTPGTAHSRSLCETRPAMCFASTPCDLRRYNSSVTDTLSESPKTPITSSENTSHVLSHVTLSPITSSQNTSHVLSHVTLSPITPRSNHMTNKRRLRHKVDDNVRTKQTQLKNQYNILPSHHEDPSQIQGPTPKNAFGFKVPSQDIDNSKAVHEYQYLTTLSVELHVATRGDLRPDPEFDDIRAIFYSIHNDIPPTTTDTQQQQQQHISHSKQTASSANAAAAAAAAAAGVDGVIIVSHAAGDKLVDKTGLTSTNTTYVNTELDLLAETVSLVKRCDADILVGYEVENSSWGYLIQRAAHFNINFPSRLSRVTEVSKENYRGGNKESTTDKGETLDEMLTDINIAGRVVINLWRILKHEVTLNIYSFENVVYHVLHKRIPQYSTHTLTSWFDHKTHLYRWRTIKYYMLRAKANLQIIDKLNIIGQTSEFARIFGIEFYHVLSRGSQYRVESMMLRLAKPLNFVAVSPSVQQRAKMRSPECIPLNLEPLSQFYTHPVVVLDFQSLYPSIMIAYNYCFSTCLGRLDQLTNAHEGPFEFGCTSLDITPTLLQSLMNDVNICPNGVVFVKQHVRHGILPRMVEEILNTRLMVKKAMKDYKDRPGLLRLLHARQLGLKLIANVTFGYTAANFSGRMPCVEVGDSILRKSRETLERAIHLVENTTRWGARVIYGDTDSMFVLLQGRTKEEAFVIGQEIADAVTRDNPKPVKLKLEKVYLPCILQTKKRYVGFMYESADQKEPVYDAKGIETVRRDSCAAVSKILERCIKLLFTNSDVSQVKSFVQRQCTKLMAGTASIQDFIFAKEYRGMTGYQPGACVPALELARQAISRDRRSEPLVSQRVPYVIVYGMPGLPLIQLVRSPDELIADQSLRLNTTYYITKQILPPLGRIFSLMGIDVMSWYNDLPRVIRSSGFGELDEYGVESGVCGGGFGGKKKGTLLGYFSSLNCPVCDERTNSGMCLQCKTDKQRVAVITSSRIHDAHRVHSQLSQMCVSCMGFIDPTLPCRSLDCPVFYRLFRADQDLLTVAHLDKLRHQLLTF